MTCFNAGLTTAEIDEWSVGLIIDFIIAKNESILKSQGKEIPNDEERYKQLKAIEPLVDQKFLKGEISKEKYEKFKKQLADWG